MDVGLCRYALLESFYEGVEVAISLLGIRRQLCTFQAVCATVEATTKRYTSADSTRNHSCVCAFGFQVMPFVC